MPVVKADPDKLRELAKKLKSSSAQLEQIRSASLRALAASGWDDRERARFEQALTADLKQLSQIARKFDTEYPSLLEKKARALDEFAR